MTRLLLMLVAAICGYAEAGQAASPSSGCGTPPTAAPTRYEVAGRTRRAIVALPVDYDAGRPHALIVAFHGRTNSNARAQSYFGLEGVASQPTIYVYPAGRPDGSGGYTWPDPGDRAAALRDFAFFDDILERMGRSYCVDLDAVFVVGHSLGASFANSLACARAGRIRGVASVAGGIAPGECGRDVAALLLHNPADRAVPISEGLRARDILLGDPLELRDKAPERLGGFECEEYRAGQDPLVWCPYHQSRTRRGSDYPHQWPRGANTVIMSFFEALER
jgi:polyhydroxybutyrate depolymerase